jgi:hypothetical protein
MPLLLYYSCISRVCVSRFFRGGRFSLVLIRSFIEEMSKGVNFDKVIHLNLIIFHLLDFVLVCHSTLSAREGFGSADPSSSTCVISLVVVSFDLFASY